LTVSFLNTSGGAIYIGAESDGKKCIIGGVSFDEDDRVKLMVQTFYREVFGKIYPQAEGDGEKVE
jgi:hypothetical protein